MDNLYSAQPANGLGGINDGSGTINPAALNSSVLSNNNPNITPDSTPRGMKRGHTPETYGDLGLDDGGIDDGSHPRKRGRPMKSRSSGGISESPVQSSMSQANLHTGLPPQTPKAQIAGLSSQSQLPASTPSQSSPPPKTTPKSVIKALPTVRDHTTDQLGPEGDEYIPREYDEAGEKKVTATGRLNDGREYRCRTFLVPHRGDKLFMLATECARVLGYRDSYLLFNKNRSLYKIIATQAEKEDLIHQEILPFSYRSRQIAIVTAKSMFRQFGSRVIVGGRRVRDDYWESKARKQGFTEDDMAGEKRPGAAKAREAASAEAANNSAMLSHQADIIYSNAPAHFGNQPPPASLHTGIMGAAGGLTPLPMITLAPEHNDMRSLGLGDYRTVPRPRQEISGPAYQDRTQPSSHQDLVVQSQHAADYNKQVNQQRIMRGQYIDGVWHKPHEAPPGSGGILAQPVEALPAVTTSMQSPRQTGSAPQQMMPRSGSHSMASGQSYSSGHQQNPMIQSPMRSMAQTTIGPDQLRNRSPSMSLPASGMGQAQNTYGYNQNQMWPPIQPQQSQQVSYQFGGPGSQMSPQIQQSPSQQTQTLRHTTSNPQMQQMQYPGMQGMPQGYVGRGMYPTDPTQQYMPQQTSGPGSQSWTGAQPPNASGNWGWQG